MNATKIITVQDYGHTHKKNVNRSTHTLSVKAKSQADNIWVKDIMIT